MKRVALIVTGQVEHKALHESLARLFPGVNFESHLRESFTSAALSPEPRLTPERPTLVEKLATALVAAVDPGRTGTPVDLAFLIDDLELFNTTWPERAINHVRAAVRAHIENRWPNAERRARTEALVRERCSFHLLAPMVEAYFFGEPAALERAGAKRDARLDPSARDLEDFQTDDPDFLGPPDARGHAWQRPQRGRHPKCYLSFLCDPSGQSRRAYRETHEGREALRSLDWAAVLEPTAHVRFARSFLKDLAEGLERPDIAGRLNGLSHPITSSPGRDPILRNL